MLLYGLVVPSFSSSLRSFFCELLKRVGGFARAQVLDWLRKSTVFANNFYWKALQYSSKGRSCLLRTKLSHFYLDPPTGAFWKLLNHQKTPVVGGCW